MFRLKGRGETTEKEGVRPNVIAVIIDLAFLQWRNSEVTQKTQVCFDENLKGFIKDLFSNTRTNIKFKKGLERE